jgi:nucleotide-binding universal stress UspA family protein
MRILVPVDGSDCSARALEFACEFAARFDADLHVVHFTDDETEAADQVIRRATEILADHDVDDEPELLSERDLQVRVEAKVGKEIVALVRERGYDHVVMGHHGRGAVDRAILGSAAEVVLRADEVPVTIIP